MRTVLFEVSSDQEHWGPAARLAKGHEGVLYLRLANLAEGTYTLSFPLHDPANPQSMPLDKTVAAVKDWKLPVIDTFPEGVTPKSVQANYQQAFTVKGRPSAPLLLRLPLKPTHNAIADIQLLCRAGSSVTTLKAQLGVTEDLRPPIAFRFYADPAVMAESTPVTFRWHVENARTISIRADGQEQYRTNTDLPSGSWRSNRKYYGKIEFSLLAEDAGQATVLKTTVIDMVNKPDIHRAIDCFSGGRLLHLFVVGGLLVALVDHGDDVRLWESDNGLEWRAENVLLQVPSFNSSLNECGRVPLEFGGSPGAVLGETIYLFGGSRYDIEHRSRALYFYDYARPERGWQKHPMLLPEERTAMSCVTFGNEIWCIGGCSKKGASDTVWSFDGQTWNTARPRLPKPRCLVAPLVHKGRLSLYGGFGSLPGLPDQTLCDALQLLGDRWQPVAWAYEDTRRFNTCAATSLHDDAFLFYACFDGKGQRQLMTSRVTGTDRLSLEDINVTEIMASDTYPAQQAVVFRDVVWLSTVSYDGSLHASQLRYFVYVPA